jgi:hypothetical protein
LIGVPARALIRVLIPPLIAATFSTSLWWAVEHLLGRSGQRGAVPGLGVLALEGLGLLATYLLVLRAVAPTWLRELRQAVLPRSVDDSQRHEN